jgi:VanZ like family
MGVLLIAVATLYPLPSQIPASAATPLLCLVCGQEGGQDVVLNLFLFAPFALGLRLAGWPWTRIVVTSGLLSLTVESLQALMIPGRDPSLSDLLTNTTGGALGAALPSLIRGSIRPPHSIRWLFLGAGFWLALQTVSGWLLSPATREGELWSGWAHVAPGPTPFEGRLRSVRLEGTSMPANAPAPTQRDLREKLDRGSVTLELEGTSGMPTKDRSLVYRVKVEGATLLSVNQWGRDLYFAVPARAHQFRFIPPTLRLPDGFPAESDLAFRVSAGEEARRLWVTSSYGPVRRSLELSLSPSQGWSLVAPFGLALGPERRLLTAAWLIVLLLPLGFWARPTGRPWLGGITLAVTLVLGLLVLPAQTGYPPVHWSEWLAGVLGGAAGWALHRLASYLQTRCGSPSNSEFSSS